MSDEHLTIDLDRDLRTAFLSAARAAERRPEDIARDLIRDFVNRERDAGDHDAWFRTAVAEALRDADDPAVSRIPYEEVAADWQRLRATLAERLDPIDR